MTKETMRNIRVVYGIVLVAGMIGCLIGLAIMLAGCQQPTAGNPFGINDPNQVESWIEIGKIIGQSSVAVGTATGNPYALAWGGGLIALGGILTSLLLKKGKVENGEST
jgi:hypothetical protein